MIQHREIEDGGIEICDFEQNIIILSKISKYGSVNRYIIVKGGKADDCK